MVTIKSNKDIVRITFNRVNSWFGPLNFRKVKFSHSH